MQPVTVTRFAGLGVLVCDNAKPKVTSATLRVRCIFASHADVLIICRVGLAPFTRPLDAAPLLGAANLGDGARPEQLPTDQASPNAAAMDPRKNVHQL